MKRFSAAAWTQCADERTFSPEILEDLEGNELFISPIVPLEVQCLYEIERIIVPAEMVIEESAMKHIVKTGDLSWEPKYFPGEEAQYGEFKPLWKEHGIERFEVRLTRIPPGGTNTKYHMHTKEEEWFYVLAGSCYINIEGEWYQIEEGDSIYKPPGQYHIFRNFGTESCELIMFGSNVEGSEVHRLPEPPPPEER